MDSDQGKLFIGGISWETSEENLKEYFGKYGEVLQTVIMKDKATGRPRGFGFVVFVDPSVLDRVLQDKHTIDGRTVSFMESASGNGVSLPQVGTWMTSSGTRSYPEGVLGGHSSLTQKMGTPEYTL